MSVITKGSLFPTALETEVFSKVKGHSTLAKLSGQEALPFNGKDIFTFSAGKDIQIVAENGEKGDNEGVATTVKMTPVKVVYQMRVSDEFMYASEEYRLNTLGAFADGFAKKLASGLDKMAMHGINPFTGSASAVIGANHFDAKVTNKVTYAAGTADTNIDDAVALVEGGEYDVNGVALSPTMRSALAALDANGARKYPELAFGGRPETLGAMALDVNATVNADKAIVGDFGAFKWGIARELPLEVIEYGNPDGQGDLKQLNQVCLRSEAYIGWAIMDPAAFAIVA